MQSLAERHFHAKLILLRTPRTLVPNVTKKTAVSVSLSPQSQSRMQFNNLIQARTQGFEKGGYIARTNPMELSF